MRRASFLLIVALVGSGAAFAQPVPKLISLFPELLQRGVSVEVTLRGEALGGVTGLVFSGESSVTATLGPRESKSETAITAKFTVAADAVVGPRELRALDSNGVSGAITLTIGNLPEVAEKSPNNTLDKAQLITLPVIVSGVINAAAETDYYRFTAKKGQDLVFDLQAARVGSALDSSLAILDTNGRELARSEDAMGVDSLIFFTVPADGDYVVQLRDLQFRGGGNFRYFLHAGALPYVESIFPFGGQRGKTVELSLTGRNLARNATITHSIEARAPLGRQELRVPTAPGFENLLPFDVGDWPEMNETEPNNRTNQANLVTTPVVINGRLGERKDIDWFNFKPATDGKLICEINARKFGSPVDALLTLTDANGAMLMQNNGAEAAEARLEFDAKKDTEYFLSLRDLNEFGGASFTYRLALHPPITGATGFVAVLQADTLRMHRDNLTKIRAEVTRQNGFDGPVRFEFEKLPPGVTAEPLLLAGTTAGGTMLLTAAKDAPPGHYPLKLIVSGKIGEKTITQTVIPSVPENLAGKPFHEAFLTVLDAAPFTIATVGANAAVDQEQSTIIEVVATRREGFTGEIKLSVEGYSAGRDPISKSLEVKEVTLKTNESSAKISMKAKIDSEIGTRPVFVRAEAAKDGRTAVIYAPPLPLTITQLPFVLSSSSQKLTLASGAETNLTVKAERRAGFTNEIALSFEGLPEGVKATNGIRIASGKAETVIKFAAATTTEKGTNYSFTILGSGQHLDRNFSHRTAAVKLNVTEPAKEKATNSVPDAKSKEKP